MNHNETKPAAVRDNADPIRYRTVNAALMRIVTVICLVCALGISLVFVFYSRSMILENADDRMLSAVEFASEWLGNDFHDRILGQDSLSREQYARILDRHDSLCRRLGLQYIWSVLVLEDRIVFTSATRADVNNPASAHASFFETHHDPHAFDPAMGPPDIPVYSSFHNEWGEGRMVLLPRLDARRRRYITGASIQIGTLSSMVMNGVWLALLSGAALFVPVWLIVRRLTRRTTGVFSLITAAVGQMRQGNLDVPLPASDLAEARQICETLDRLRRELQQRIGELRHSESKYRSLVENTSDIIYSLTAEGIYSFVSPAWTRLLGHPTAEIPGRSFSEFVHPDDLPRCDAFWQKVRDKGERQEGVEYRVRHHNGPWRWHTSSAGPVRDADGAVTGFDGIARDITEGVQRGEALRISEEWYRAIYDTSPLAMVVWDRDCVVRNWNRQAERIFGWTREEAIGRNFVEFLLPESARATVSEVVDSLLQRRIPSQSTNENLTRSGDRILCQWNNSIQQDSQGRITGVVSLALDITERKRMEEAVQAERDQLLQVFHSIDEAIYIADPRTHELLYVNRFAADLLPGDCIGLKCYQALQGLDAPCSFCTNEMILRQKPEPHRWEFYNANLGRHYSITDRIIRWSDGRDVRFELAIDITAIRQSQKNLAAKNKELEQLVYVASHDLRSPLVNVDGFSRELEFSLAEIGGLLEGGSDRAQLEKVLKAEFPDMTRSLERIRASTRQMDNLLKGLLKLSRSGRAALRIEPLDMNELLRQLAASFAFRIEKAGVALTVGELPPCRGDAVQVTQIFSNLIDNAIKYLDRGRPGRIGILGAAEGDRALYRVEDNGIGIAGNHCENIFELFHRLHPGETDGEGLGLTIARQILGRMEGEIAVESKPGQGSTFIVSLPGVKGKKL